METSSIERAKEMNDILFMENEFVVLDLETTGLSPLKGGRIIEVAGVKVQNGKIVDTFNEFINPELKIPAKITEITSITNEMVKGSPVYGKVLPDFYRFIGDSVVGAHNAPFDWDRYLMHYFPKVGIYPKNKVVDTLLLSKFYFPELKKYKLNLMCEKLGIELESHHRAIADTIATAQMLILFKEQYATSMFQGQPATNSGQLDLFALASAQTNPQPKEVRMNLEIEEVGEPDDAMPTPQKIPYKIKRIKYWEKPITKKKSYQRLYVMLSIGTAYFDIPSKTWYNKDVKEDIDFGVLNESVLKYLHLQTVDELCNFRN